MTKKFKSLLIILFASPVFSAETFNWNKATEQALNSNPELQSSAAQVRSNEYLKYGAYSGFLPTASLSLVESKTNAVNSVFNSGTTQYTFSGNSSINLFAGFQDIAKIQQAEANYRVARANLNSIRARISAELKTAFASLQYAKEYKTLTLQIIKRRTENLQMIELSFNNGRENKGSLYLAQAYLKQAEYDNLQANNAVTVAKAQLARILGLDEDEDFDITGEIPLNKPEAAINANELARKTPDIQLSSAQLDSAAASVRISKSQFSPTLAMSGSIDNIGPHLFPDQRHRWGLSLNLVLPFFNGGKDLTNLLSSLETRNGQLKTLENSQRLIKSKLRQSHVAYVEALAKFEVDQKFKEAVITRAEIARGKYNNGLLSFENWDIIENDLINRQKNFLTSKRDRITAEANWEQTQGVGLSHD